jgi:hypothetical protein
MNKRAGVTEKLSISIHRQDAVALRMRAKRLHGGNLSAVIAEFAADARRLEAQHLLVVQLGGGLLTDADRRSLDLEWRPVVAKAKKSRQASKKPSHPKAA